MCQGAAYIPLNGAFCYLSTILDGCTKQVLSYVLSESLEVAFVLETVQKIHLQRLAQHKMCIRDSGSVTTSSPLPRDTDLDTVSVFVCKLRSLHSLSLIHI